jgi:protein O-mannosyl-transferase
MSEPRGTPSVPTPRPPRSAQLASAHAPLAAGPLGPALLVGVVAALVYARTLGAGFVWDDHVIVEANRAITSLANVPAAFGAHAFAGARAFFGGDRSIEYYRPLWVAWLALQYAVAGLQPAGYHAGSILLHALASVAVLLLARTLLADATAALFAALLFAVHPAHVEAVAWISASNELLAGLFGVLFVLAYAHLRAAGGAWNAALCVVALVCALLSKETAAALPLLALALELRPGADGLAKRLRWPAAFAAVALAALVLRGRIVAPHPDPHPLIERLLTAPRLLVEYVRLLFVPLRLAVFHDVPLVTRAAAPAFLLPLAVCVLLVVAIVWARRRAPALCVGLAWIAAALLPVAGIVALPQPAFLAERYLYLASVGAVLCAGAAYAFAARAAGPALRGAVAALGLLLLAGLAFASARQAAVWHDDVTLMTRMVADAPHAAMGHANLGAAFERRDRLDDAEREYRIAAQLEPGDHMMHRNLGIALAKLGRNAEAERELGTALTLDPGYATARGDLGWVYAREGRWPDAIREYAAAFAREPGSAANRAGLADAHYNLGVALSGEQRIEDAAREFAAALALEQHFAKAHFNLGAMRARQGRNAEALAEFDRAIAFAAADTALAGRARAARRTVEALR